MEPCWGRGQGRLGVFETETETEIEAETKGGGESQKEGMTWSQRSKGLGRGGRVPYTQGPGVSVSPP